MKKMRKYIKTKSRKYYVLKKRSTGKFARYFYNYVYPYSFSYADRNGALTNATATALSEAYVFKTRAAAVKEAKLYNQRYSRWRLRGNRNPGIRGYIMAEQKDMQVIEVTESHLIEREIVKII